MFVDTTQITQGGTPAPLGDGPVGGGPAGAVASAPGGAQLALTHPAIGFAVLSFLPPCPPRERLRATAACRALRRLAPRLPVWSDPFLGRGRFDALVATGEGHDDVLRGAATAGPPAGGDRLVLAGEDDGEVAVDGRVLTASADVAVDGDANLWARWSEHVPLGDAPVVLCWRARLPRNPFGGGRGLLLGLCAPGHFDTALAGGWAPRGQVGAWAPRSHIVHTVGDEGTEGGGGGAETLRVLLVLDPARCEVVVSVEGEVDAEHAESDDDGGEEAAAAPARSFVFVERRVIPADEWPAREDRLVPFTCVQTECFNGFEEVGEADLPLRVEAISSADARAAARLLFTPAGVLIAPQSLGGGADGADADADDDSDEGDDDAAGEGGEDGGGDEAAMDEAPPGDATWA